MRVGALLAILIAAAAMDAATVTVRVTDSTGAALPGVSVEAAGAMCVTARDGACALELYDGAYDLSFRLINFASVTRRGVTVPATQPVDVTLYLSASADVVVTAARTFRNLRDLDEPVDDLIGIADAASVGVVTADEIARRPVQRAGGVLETVPGVVVSQHSGEGKANQYYLRGFNLDHGTDIAVTVAGVPVNMPTHAHGQGYADANFLIPELIGGVQYKKGPYYADEGDFASAGAVNINYLSVLERPIVLVQGGMFGYGRALVAGSHPVGGGFGLFALETMRSEGPWEQPDDYRRVNGVLRYSTGGQRGGASITAMLYDAKWNATDQIPRRAVESGAVSRFGLIDGTGGGDTSRISLAAEWQRNSSTRLAQVTAYALRYRLNLFSNFTYFLDDPIHGDQFEQADDRLAGGLHAVYRWLAGRTENVAGLQLRHDDIGTVGLYHTAARRRLDTIREDSVRQTSAGGYAQSHVQWRDTLRTVLAVRADRYRFDVGGVASDDTLLSPKLSVIFGPWRGTELYVNAGRGFHSNDARSADGGTPLVPTRGAEIGVRTTVANRVHLTAAAWGLDIDSELLFAGDAGTTEEGRGSRRTGVEVAVAVAAGAHVRADAQYAASRARFRDDDPAGDRIPGAVEGVATVGLALVDAGALSGELRYRWFGPRPLIEDDSVRSESSGLWSTRVSYALTRSVRLDVDVFNLLDANVSDIDYFYTSRLCGEPRPVDDVHFHSVEKRAVRVGLSTMF